MRKLAVNKLTYIISCSLKVITSLFVIRFQKFFHHCVQLNEVQIWITNTLHFLQNIYLILHAIACRLQQNLIPNGKLPHAATASHMCKPCTWKHSHYIFTTTRTGIPHSCTWTPKLRLQFTHPSKKMLVSVIIFWHQPHF